MSSLFGSTPQVTYTPSGLSNSTGFNVSGGGNVSESPQLAQNIGGLQNTFMAGGAAFGNLASQVNPIMGQVTRAGLAQISNQGKQALSTLNSNLAQRRVLGSSFANSAISEQNANTAEAKANFVAQSQLQSLQAQAQLIQQQYSLYTQSYQSAINQSNIESSTAASLVASNNQTQAQIASANAQLTAQSQAGAGALAGTVFSALTNGGLGGFGSSALGSGLSSLAGGDAAESLAEMLVFA